MTDAAAPGSPAARSAAPLQLTVVHDGVTHIFNFVPGTKIAVAKAQVCAHFIPKEPANDYLLAINEDGTWPESGLPTFQIQQRKLAVPEDDPDHSSEKEASSESVSPPTTSPNSSLRPGEAKEAQMKLLTVLDETMRRPSDASDRASLAGGEARNSGGGSRIVRTPDQFSPSPRVGSLREDRSAEQATKIVIKEQKAVIFKVERTRSSSEPSTPVMGKLTKEPSREVHRELKPFDITVLEPGAFEEKEYDELNAALEASAASALPPIEAGDECEVVVKEEDGRRIVMGGTVDNLVLLFLQNADRDAVRDFLYTFPYFTTANDVLDRVTRLFASPPSYISEDSSKNIFKSRIVAFLKFWVENHFYFFMRDDTLQMMLSAWIESLDTLDPLHGKRYQIVMRESLGKQVALTKPKNPSLVEAVGVAMQHPRTGLLGNKKKYKDGKIDGSEIVDWLMSNMRIKTRYEAEILGNHLLNQYLWAVAGKRAPFKDTHDAYFTLTKPKKDAVGETAQPEVKLIDKLKDPKQVTMLKLHPTELARQLTLLESDIVKRIKPPELMQSAWKKPNKKELAPGITELIIWFNKINSWVATEIVMNQNIKHRALTISRFIWAADACRQMGNYNGVMEIISALHLGAIQSLKKTWKEVPEKDIDLFKELSALMNLTDNYRVYREEILKRERERQALVPYTGVFFQDFLIVEELPDKLANGIINFQKMRRVAFMIGRLRRYQIRTYIFKPVKCIQEYLQQYLSVLSEADLYKWAKMAEGGAGGMSMRQPALTVSAPPPAQLSPLSTSSSSQRSDSEKDKLPSSESKGEVKDERKHHHESKDSEERKKGHSRSMSSGNSSMLHTINPLRASTAQVDKKDEKKDHKK